MALDAGATRPPTMVAAPSACPLWHLMDAVPTGRPLGLTEGQIAPPVALPLRPWTVDQQEALATIPAVLP